MATQPAQTLFQRIEQSFMSSIGAIVFGMEDGTVSTFGLVFGKNVVATALQTLMIAAAAAAAGLLVSLLLTGQISG